MRLSVHNDGVQCTTSLSTYTYIMRQQGTDLALALLLDHLDDLAALYLQSGESSRAPGPGIEPDLGGGYEWI
jgi:hypothetical protein